MQTITMSAKGQIVIPLRIRKKFGLKKGKVTMEDKKIKGTHWYFLEENEIEGIQIKGHAKAVLHPNINDAYIN